MNKLYNNEVTSFTLWVHWTGNPVLDAQTGH